MRGTWRTTLHAALLALLVADVAYGVAVVAGFLGMVAGTAAGWMPLPELTATRIAFSVLMVLLWGGIIMAGLTSLVRQCRSTRELSRWVAGVADAPSPRLARNVRAAGCRGPVVEVPADSPYAFTYGIWRPRIVVSSALVKVASDAELVAVLRHEDHHVRNRDPLKVLALRTWGAAFFLIPVVGAVLQRVLDRQELGADRAALHSCGVPPVAGALLKATGQPVGRDMALAAMGGPALLDARITQLETGRAPGLLTALGPEPALRSLPGVGVVALYGVLVYQVCVAAQACFLC